MTAVSSESDSALPDMDPVVAPESAEAPVRKSVGQTLRDARITRGLSVDEVADVLRFSARQIEHLENDNYQALPGATLVRGFIRGYAKFLRLDPEQLLTGIDAVVPPETSDVRPPTQIGNAHEGVGVAVFAPGRLLAVVAAILLVLLTGYLFVQMDQAPVVDVAVPPVQAPAPVVQEPVSGTPEIVNREQGPGQSATDVVQTTTAPATAQTGQGVAPEVPAAPAVATGLSVEFDDLSWIEVRDADKNVVLVGEYPKGTKRSVDGKAPFTLWVGRASVVRIFYRGQAVDLKSGSREDVARLTIE